MILFDKKRKEKENSFVRLVFHVENSTKPSMTINECDKLSSTRTSRRTCRTPDYEQDKMVWDVLDKYTIE